jgi:hypothetical protein
MRTYTIYKVYGNDLVVVKGGCTRKEVLDFLGIQWFNGLNHGLNGLKKSVHTTKEYTVINN